MNSRAFSLVELLVAITILAILVVLGSGAASAALGKADATRCLSSLRQAGIAIQLYGGDNSGRLPDTGHVRASDGTSLSWTNTLSGYLSTNFIGRCPACKPSAAAVTYAWNDLLTEADGTGIPIVKCRAPSSTLAVGEVSDTYTSEHFHFAAARSRITFNQFKSSVGVNRHGPSANYLFVDGHVAQLTPDQVRALLSSTNTTFLQP